MRVAVDIREKEVEGDYGVTLGLHATCERCGHAVEVTGAQSWAAAYAAVKLRAEYPRGDSNFYDTAW